MLAAPPHLEPLFRLRASFWATSALRNPELRLHRNHLELHVPQGRRCIVHRVRYDRISRVEFVEGHLFTDVVVTTVGGVELVAPGLRHRDLAAGKRYLSLCTAACTPS